MTARWFEEDLGAAAFLRARGHQFVGLSRVPGQSFYTFEFADDGECADDAESYANGGQCDARELVIALHNLKQILRRKKGMGNEYNCNSTK